MIRPLSLLIGLRYIRAKRRNHFISFISMASMLGIALGVAVLITVLSVMNGFDHQIRLRFFEMIPEVTVVSRIDQTDDLWQKTIQTTRQLPGVVGISSYVSGNAVLMQGAVMSGLELRGITPKEEVMTSGLAKVMVLGQLDSLVPGDYHIIIGQTLAQRLGVTIGDSITVFTPQINVTLLGSFPLHRQFTVSGIFHTSESFGLDTAVAYIDKTDAKKLFARGQGVSGIHVKVQDIYDALGVTDQLNAVLPPAFVVSNWTQTAGAFFSALKMEKTMMFVILLLIIAVAVFNLVSSLVMLVNDKRSDIAILRTIGATPGMILRVFIIQGAVIGAIGTLLGVIGGVILSLNATALTAYLEHLFHVQFISSNVYIIDFLPSEIHVADVILVSAIALALSFIATLYPAWVASRTQPAEALRYE